MISSYRKGLIVLGLTAFFGSNPVVAQRTTTVAGVAPGEAELIPSRVAGASPVLPSRRVELQTGIVADRPYRSESEALFAQQGSKLVGTGAVGGSAWQGYSSAISADGNTAIVGGIIDDGEAGAAWVWTRSGGVWSQQGEKLVGSDAVGKAQQGYSVAISADGNTAIVGGWADNARKGAAWIWSRSGGVWTQQGPKLVGSGAVGDAEQGLSVSISSDGNTAIVGGHVDNNFTGAAWVWTRSGGVWTQQGSKLVGSDPGPIQGQGSGVALSGDGNTAMIGAPSYVGAVWVWTRSGGTWTQQGSKLVGSGAVGNANQGFSVSLSSDGNTGIVGGWPDNSFAGAAWVFARSGGVWTQQGAKLVGTGAVGAAAQGYSVSISADGNTVIVGGWFDNGGPTGSQDGAAWVWTRSAGVWSQQGNKLAGSGAVSNAGQGHSVSIAGDGNTAIVGGFTDYLSGAAWVWTRSGGTWTQQGPKLVGSGVMPTASQGNSVAISEDGNTAIVGGPTDDSNAGAVWIWTRNGSLWSQQGPKLVGAGAAGKSYQGYSVAISADGNTALVSGPLDNGSSGATWVWTRSAGTWTQQGPKLAGAGNAVAVSADGNTAIVGNPSAGSGAGAAQIWTRSGGVWTQQGAPLIGSGAIGLANQGWSVALSADGNTAIVGGPADNGAIGAAWIWTRSGGVWSQQGPRLGGWDSVGNAQQGMGVSLSADGNTALVVGSRDEPALGAAWIWTRSGGVWTQQGPKLVGSDVAGSAQLLSGSLSADGNMAIVGGNEDDHFKGAAWIWSRSGGVWTQQGAKLVGSGAPIAAGQGSSVSLSADGNTAIVGAPADNGRAGAAWIFVNTAIPAPAAVTAVAFSATRVDVTWANVGVATSYQIDRRSAGGAFAQIGTSVTNSFSDLTASPNSAYLYRVRAVADTNVSSSSIADLATTVLFNDNPLTGGIGVKATHLSQLRTAVNALRLLAALPMAGFTDAATPGTRIRGVHLTELRTALDEARSSLGLSAGGYTDNALSAVAVKALHSQELRNRVQ